MPRVCLGAHWISVIIAKATRQLDNIFANVDFGPAVLRDIGLTHSRYHEPSLDSHCALQHYEHVSSILLQGNRFSPLPSGHFFACLISFLFPNPWLPAFFRPTPVRTGTGLGQRQPLPAPGRTRLFARRGEVLPLLIYRQSYDEGIV
jgi:hypothetical protein